MEIILNSDNFEEEVLKSDKPVLVDFFATWCGPCKMMAPIVEEFAIEQADKVKVGVLDIDQAFEIADKYNVMSIPTFKLFKGGEVAVTAVGAIGREGLEEKILSEI